METTDLREGQTALRYARRARARCGAEHSGIASLESLSSVGFSGSRLGPVLNDSRLGRTHDLTT